MSDMPNTADLEKLVDLYCAAWGEPDAGRRSAMLREVSGDGATYTDPRTHASDLDQLVAHIGRVLAVRPGARVIRTSAVDSHHGLARFAWCVVLSDRTRLPEGVDFVELTADGKIARIVGFFGPLAPLADE